MTHGFMVYRFQGIGFWLLDCRVLAFRWFTVDRGLGYLGVI